MQGCAVPKFRQWHRGAEAHYTTLPDSTGLRVYFSAQYCKEAAHGMLDCPVIDHCAEHCQPKRNMGEGTGRRLYLVHGKDTVLAFVPILALNRANIWYQPREYRWIGWDSMCERLSSAVR